MNPTHMVFRGALLGALHRIAHLLLHPGGRRKQGETMTEAVMILLLQGRLRAAVWA